MLEKTDHIVGMIESFLFIAGDEGLTLKQLIHLTNQYESTVKEAINQLKENYETDLQRGITIKIYGGAYRLVTKSTFANNIKKMLENPVAQTMTKASLEVLSIIAYKQPVTRVEIDDLRGVKSDGPIHTLISRGLIMEKGRAEGVGRAILYGTTDLFLDRFGLKSLDDLPNLSIEEQEDEGDPDLFMTQFQEVFEIEKEEEEDN